VKKVVAGVVLLAVVSVSCAHFTNMFSKKARFDLQGHRGCRGLLPENTIAAMLKAAELGVTTLEMDVVITADNKVLLSHEPWMNEDITTRPDGSYMQGKAEAMQHNIYRLTYEQTTAYDVGKKPHPRFAQQEKMAAVKPLLEEVIVESERYSKKTNRAPLHYNIETKCTPAGDGIYHPSPKAFIDLLLPILKANNIEHRTTIQSFDIRSLQYLHEVAPAISTALLIEDNDTASLQSILQRIGFTPSIYSPHYSLVNKELVTACHARGMQIIPWTVNDIETMRRLKALGVDGLISDYPNLYKDL
jgi:glycerophosphoryl diester phosphodiesterase